MSEAIYGYAELLEALHFAAEKHRDQRRKGSDASPYINHPIQATCNVGDVTHDPPESWPLERRVDYLDWTEQLVAGCRGVNAALEAHCDELIQLGRKQLSD